MMQKKPRIHKLGTIECDLVETTPVVFGNCLYRFEYVRSKYYLKNTTGDTYFRFVDHETGEFSQSFAVGYHFGNVMVDNISGKEQLVVTGTNVGDGEKIDIFTSTDMSNWETWNALTLPGYGLFNTSMCKAGDQYVLMFEVGKPPEIAGVRFTARFATSHDLHTWELTPPECTYAKDRYTAPHALRFLDGYYYNFYLEAVPDGWEQYVVRSKDLVEWEQSPHNPVLRASDEDRIIYSDSLTCEERERILNAKDNNNSDIDFCEFNGKLIINYSWGNQHGVEHLAEAYYDGTEDEFLRSWFAV